MSIDVKLKVTDIQRFCMHDGPGIRTTVFLKGCPMRCSWCHNPETQKTSSELLFYSKKCINCKSCFNCCSANAHCFEQLHKIDREKCISCFSCSDACPTGALEVCGKDMSIEEILNVVEKDDAFYGEAGGITVSGGESFAQKEATVELLRACKERGISTAVETCGYVSSDILKMAIPFVDLFLWDIKDTDDDRHKRYTGVSKKLILENLQIANKMRANIRLRCILVNGINTDELHYNKIAEIAKSLDKLDCVEFIPYHAYGGAKSAFLGFEENGKKEWIPNEEEVLKAKNILTNKGVMVI